MKPAKTAQKRSVWSESTGADHQGGWGPGFETNIIADFNAEFLC